ncbi:hypothetical protein PFNF54_02985 [Plasmodium falciparum NF54]|uniref:Uncharacterized protein n=1 Tax=Plasmodium falciparum (isolate NF54) TaxID=5843 RepID=W7JU21_PLAFO|nr:hypothetical protein PFNF54_02985 [Plasmodium falciparum NF54]
MHNHVNFKSSFTTIITYIIIFVLLRSIIVFILPNYYYFHVLMLIWFFLIFMKIFQNPNFDLPAPSCIVDVVDDVVFVMENGPTYPKYYYFPIVKIYPFLKFFIGGGIALSANFSSKFWTILSLNCHNYFIQKLILLHLGAKDSYNYDFLVIQILALIFDQNTSLLFPHKITYVTSEHVITKFGLHILSYNSLITCTLNISWSKKYFIL